jgi:hypothetical protein
MKKLFVLVAVATIMTSCGKSDYKYTITDSTGTRYGADFYNETGEGCILFNDKNCGCSDSEGPGAPTRLCGSYTIVENKQAQ